MARLAEPEQLELRQRFERCLGKELAQLLAEPDVSDVLVNADGRVWAKRVGHRLALTDYRMADARLLAVIKTIGTLVGALVNDEHPVLEARVPGFGWRFEGLVPPVVEAPVLAIRKPAPVVFPLEHYLARGEMSERLCAALRDAVRDRRNILVVGGTGSGKTTLVNAILHEVARLDPNERPVIIEDTPELQCACEGKVSLLATSHTSMAQLLVHTLRLFPSRIIVGEVRASEALVLLNALNTGHEGGVSTVHANSARAGLVKLEQMAAQGAVGGVPRSLIALTINVVVFIRERGGKRCVEELISVRGVDAAGNYEFGEVIT